MVQPTLTVLTSEQIQQTHAYALQILAQTGVRVDSPRARQIFAAADGATLDDDRVLLNPSLVDWAIRSAPSQLDIYNRHGEPAFSLGSSSARFGIGVTNLYYQDPASDTVTPFARQHMAISVRLGEALSQFDLVSTIGIIQDIPQTIADLYAALEMTANTLKPLALLISDESLFVPILDMLEQLHGDLAGKPFLLPYFNPVTPLVMNAGTTDKMQAAIERGLPFIYSNYGMVGMSTPITPAGTLSLLIAELLAGLTLSQLTKEGTPIVLGSLPAYFDMKDMLDYYDPLTFVMNLACAELMAYYHIPHAGTSGSGLGWGPDLLAGGLLWMDHLTTCLGKVGLAPFVGGNLGSKAFSPAMVVYANDVIQQARRLAKGFAFDDTQVGLDEITLAGPGGDFLTAGLTLQNFRKNYYTSQVFPRLSLETWQEKGQPQAVQYLRERTLQLLDQTHPPDDHAELISRGEAFIHSLAGNKP